MKFICIKSIDFGFGEFKPGDLLNVSNSNDKMPKGELSEHFMNYFEYLQENRDKKLTELLRKV